MIEYQTTTVSVADFYDSSGKRLQAVFIKAPEGRDWKLVSTTATESVVFYTWKRSQ